MYTGQTLFAQLMEFVPWTTFTRLVERYGGDHRVRTLSCAEQYRAMAFAQLTYRESLRDIETCLSAQTAKLYHMGFREPVLWHVGERGEDANLDRGVGVRSGRHRQEAAEAGSVALHIDAGLFGGNIRKGADKFCALSRGRRFRT
jgi:hypothetical protein